MLLQKCLLDTTLFLIKHANIKAVQESVVITVLAVNEMCQVIQIFWSVKEERSPSCRLDCRGVSFCLHYVKSNLDVSLKRPVPFLLFLWELCGVLITQSAVREVVLE